MLGRKGTAAKHDAVVPLDHGVKAAADVSG